MAKFSCHSMHKAYVRYFHKLAISVPKHTHTQIQTMQMCVCIYIFVCFWLDFSISALVIALRLHLRLPHSQCLCLCGLAPTYVECIIIAKRLLSSTINVAGPAGRSMLLLHCQLRLAWLVLWSCLLCGRSSNRISGISFYLASFHNARSDKKPLVISI